MQPLIRPLSIALLVGTALLGVGAMLHPILPHDPSMQLRMIAETWYFRPIHLAMLAGSALIILGIWTRALLAPTVALAAHGRASRRRSRRRASTLRRRAAAAWVNAEAQRQDGAALDQREADFA